MTNKVHVILRTWHKDASGRNASDIAKMSEKGAIYLHVGTQTLYKVVGVGWDSERDRWTIRYRAVNRDPDVSCEDEWGPNTDFDFHHLPEDFFREGRFIEVKR